MKSITSVLIVLVLLALTWSACKKDEDKNPPVITLKGAATVISEMDSVYTDAGATAYDQEDGDITSKIVTTDNIDIHAEGTYWVRYNVKDDAGNAAAEVTRTVKVMIFK
jgi:hypothetical protein